MKNKKYTEYLEFAKNVAKVAGKIMLENFDKLGVSSYKEDKSIVTEADMQINSYLIDEVQKRYPTHAVLGEEQSLSTNSNYVWICDPVDGTAQFARGVPVAVFSLALVIAGKPIVAVIYDPFLKDLYYAIKGSGAYKNDTKLKVSDTKLTDKEAVLNYNTGTPRVELNMELLRKIRNDKRVFCVSIGSIARSAMLVASGRYIATIYSNELGCEGIAGAKLIVEEAGGVVKNFAKEEIKMCGRTNGVILCNNVVLDEIL